MDIKTKIICSDNSADFQYRTNKALEEGWRISPNTLQSSITSTSNAWDSKAQVNRSFVVILEKEDKNTT